MEERREFERFELEIPATIDESGEVEDIKKLALKSRDISAGGGFFPTSTPLREGEEVQLDLALEIEKLKRITDSKCRVIVKGIVVRSDAAGMAIRFHPNYRILPTKSILH